MENNEPAQAPSRSHRRLWGARRAARESWDTLKDYIVRVAEKADDDNIFLLASGLTFSILVAAIPFLLIIVSLISLTLEAAAEAAGLEPIEQLRRYVDVLVPVLGEAGAEAGGSDISIPEEVIRQALRRDQAVGLISFVAFVWFATRLFGSVRAVLREIFDLRQSRGPIQGKIFDAEMVLVSSVLVILNIGITIAANLAKTRSFEFLGLTPERLGIAEAVTAQVTALAFIFLLFLLLYKYVPARRIPWRMAVTAAAFTAICWELLKLGFAFYLTRIADYRSIYGGLATLVLVVIWVYYLSIVFVLGAEVAQVHELRRVRRQQIEVLE
ncbi:MAG: YihY/virulence factor BrkB family protein [Gemmatimonadota bacterium]|nr:MAG: YihY/virulence factor BrkB family protein [Gemmatimonadota bacterium]